MQEVKAKVPAGTLVPVESALTEFDKVSAGLVDLTRKYANVVYPVTTTKGMDEARAARLDIRNVRYAVQRAEKSASDELNSIKRNVKDRADQIITVIEPLEFAIDSQIKAEESRKAEEKRKKDEAEAARVASIRARISDIASLPAQAAGKHSSEIGAMLRSISEIAIDSSFDEFIPHAADTKEQAVSALITLQAKAALAEQAEAIIAAQREELENFRRQVEAQRAELEAARTTAEAARVAEEQARNEAFARSEAARLAAEAEVARLSGASQEDAFQLEQELANEEVKLALKEATQTLSSIKAEYAAMGIDTKPALQYPVAVEGLVNSPMPFETIELKHGATPTGIDIVMAVADYYGTTLDQAWEWIMAINPAEINEAIAEAA